MKQRQWKSSPLWMRQDASFPFCRQFGNAYFLPLLFYFHHWDSSSADLFVPAVKIMRRGCRLLQSDSSTVEYGIEYHQLDQEEIGGQTWFEALQYCAGCLRPARCWTEPEATCGQAILWDGNRRPDMMGTGGNKQTNNQGADHRETHFPHRMICRFHTSRFGDLYLLSFHLWDFFRAPTTRPNFLNPLNPFHEQ